MFTGEVKAAYSSNRYSYNGSNLDTNAYPGFKERIDALKTSHPNWTFTIMETGLDWNQVITAETAGHWGSPLNLIQENQEHGFVQLVVTHHMIMAHGNTRQKWL